MADPERWTLRVCDVCREPMNGATGHGHGTGRVHGGLLVEVAPIRDAEKAQAEHEAALRLAMAAARFTYRLDCPEYLREALEQFNQAEAVKAQASQP